MFKQTKTHKDGSIEELTLHRHQDGTFKLLVSVKTLEEAKKLAKEWNIVGARLKGPISQTALVNFEVKPK
jgi:hypothetical protein